MGDGGKSFKAYQAARDLNKAKADFADEYFAELGMPWCDSCKGYHATSYQMTLKESIDGPEEGVNFCENCGERRDD